MKVLVFSVVYRPEMGAQGVRMDSIVRQLVSSGHDVSVATGMPNYPTGVIHPDYVGKKKMTETVEGAKVYRTAYYTVPRNQTKLGQMLSYLAMIPAAFSSGMRAPKPDVVFVTSPPLFSAIPAMMVAKVRRAKLIVDLRDMWPDEMVACGGMKETSLPVRIMRIIERKAYAMASYVSCTTQAIIRTVGTRGVPVERTVFTPNGADTTLWQPQAPENPIAAEYNFGDKFVVMYSGLLGIKHNLDTLLDAAKILQKLQPNITVFIRGAGPKRADLDKRVSEEHIANVQFGEERAVEDIPFILARANACVTGLLPDPYLDKIISVKIFEYMACAKPVVAGLAGESARVIDEADAGIIVPAGDADAMARAIIDLYDNPDTARAMGERGRDHIIANYTRDVTAKRLEAAMLSLVGTGSNESTGAPPEQLYNTKPHAAAK